MKNFLVINTSFFGDTLITDPLCRNIKMTYPEAKIVFIVNKPFYEVAKYLDGVDEVVPFDKKGKHHGIKGAWHFYKQYKDKFSQGFEAAFIIYGNERNIVLAKLFGAKKIYAQNTGLINILLSNPKNIDYHQMTKVQDQNSILWEQYTHKDIQILPMKYNPPQIAYDKANKLLPQEKKYIGICAVSKKKAKDMPLSTCIELINKLKSEGRTVVLLGAGKASEDYIAELAENNCTEKDFINLVNKTSISELAAVLAKCEALISVDTGTMHLGLAMNVPTLCLFYIATQEHLAKWAPTDIYNCKVITYGFLADNILDKLHELIRLG